MDTEIEYKQVSLYGGAATCMIPSAWVDVSTLRDVPDHQEVYVHPTAQYEQSVIIEILAHETDILDADAGKYFFNDLAHADGSTSSEIQKSVTFPRQIEILNIDAVEIHMEGIQTKGKTGHSSITQAVLVYMDVIRVPKLGSDILITCHSLPDGIGSIKAIHQEITRSLKFVDSTLFA
jgi:hypothetical protein